MNESDYSRKIFEKYYGAKDHLLKITLRNKTVLEGIFIGFVHGDESFNEPYIIKWHFLSAEEIEKQNHLISTDGGEDYGVMLEQDDIVDVIFKE